MELRFFRCAECDKYYVGYTDKGDILCGTLIGFATRDGEDVPVGCGERLAEVTQEEATEAAYRKRDNNE